MCIRKQKKNNLIKDCESILQKHYLFCQLRLLDGGHFNPRQFNPRYYTVNSIVSVGVEMSNFDTKSGHFNPRYFNPRKFNSTIKADLPRQ